jgi:hypothetical protein
MSWRCFLAAVVLLLSCSAGVAEQPGVKEHDLAPLSAVVLLDRGGEVVLDLTHDDGAQVGDLFSVVEQEQSRKQLKADGVPGSLDGVISLLRIIQVRPGFSIAKRIAGEPLQPGAEIHRFEHVAEQYAELPTSLPVPADAAITRLPAGTIKTAEPESGAALSAKWLGAGAKGLPVGVGVADFDGDGRLEIARAFETRLEIGRLRADDYEHLYSSPLASETTAIALTAVDLNGNGRTELFLTTVREDEVHAEVFEYTGGRYLNVARKQPWFLNSIELPGKGVVLLGQKRDRSHYGFSAEIDVLEWKGRQLSPKAALTLPEKRTIYSLAALSAAGKDRFAGINGDGRIEIFSNADDALWVSDEKGYSETGFLQADARNPHWDAEFLHKVFLPPALISGPGGSVITAINTGRTGSDKYRQMKSLTLTGWQWRNQELQPLWRMADMDGYVPAMTVADADNDGQDELVLLIAHPKSNFFGPRKSVIKLFELK